MKRRGCLWSVLLVLALVSAATVWVMWPTVVLAPQFAPIFDSAPVASSHLTPARVVKVVDGDTIDVVVNGDEFRVRYIGMDTPERNEAYFRAATAANRDLVGGRTVYLEKDVSDTDRYGRLLRYVYLPDGRMVNEELVAAGLAHAATFQPDVRYTAQLQAAQLRAEAAGRGLWAD